MERWSRWTGKVARKLFVIAAVAASALCLAEPQRLPDLGQGGLAYRVNESGVIAGSVVTPEMFATPAMWVGGELTVLKQGLNGQSRAVNASGHVVGFGIRPEDHTQFAFVYRGGEFTQLPDLGFGSAAFDITDSGLIVGWVQSESGAHAAVWRDGALQVLPNLIEAMAGASAANEGGRVLGFGFGLTDHRAFVQLWVNGNPQEISSAGGFAFPSAMNEAGAAVGTANVDEEVNGTVTHRGVAVLWTPAGEAQILSSPLGERAEAYDISDNGVIAGMVTDFGLPKPVVWRNGVLEPLPLPEIEYSNGLAYGVNSAGQVVGTYFDPAAQAHVAAVWGEPMPTGPRLVLQNVQGAPGERVMLRAQIMDGNRPVANHYLRLRVDGPIVAEGRTNSQGNFVAMYTIPSESAIGSQDLMGSLGGSNYIKRRLDVVPATTKVSVSNAGARRGSSVTLQTQLWNSSTGRPLANQVVTLEANGVMRTTVKTDRNGRVRVSVRVPRNVNPGRYTLTSSFAGDSRHKPSTGSAILTIR